MPKATAPLALASAISPRFRLVPSCAANAFKAPRASSTPTAIGLNPCALA